ncbi:ATP synthase subunit e, mitochondrial [Hylaeus anthracinus]|uniref:ATP synthase subunit e, mitochondrial n=1 Tax=Hylaeus anthracinus TaxID=313031 RepID=UPI0023B9200F|nr:ATP synthase subunit e, mitochondrial [Hylaeus anthracinus]
MSYCICKMSSVEATPKPLRVSPLIKFSRWTLLLAGVVYGAYHHNRFSKKEEALREKALREKPMRDAKLAAEKKQRMIDEAKFLDDLINVKT